MTVIVVSMAVLYGWLNDIEFLKSVLPGRTVMTVKTAVCFSLLGACAYFLCHPRMGNHARLAVLITSASVFLLAVLNLFRYFTGIDPQIDSVLFDRPIKDLFGVPAKAPSPITSINFALMSLALITVNLGGIRWIRFAQFLAILTFLASFQGFLSYVAGLEYLMGTALYSKMAVHTALCFMLLSIAFLLSRSNEGLMEAFSGDAPSAIMARRMLGAVLLVPPFLSWLITEGRRAGYYGQDFTDLAKVMGTIVFMSGVVVLSARTLLRVERERARLMANERAMLEEAERERARLYAVFLQAPTHVDIYKGPEHVFDLAHPLTIQTARGKNIRGMRLRDVFPESVRSGVIERMDRVFATGVTENLREQPLTFMEQNHETQFFNISFQAWRNRSGDIEGVIVFSVNVTDEVRARTAIESSREEARRAAEHLQLIIDSLPSTISYVDRDLRYLMVNAVYEKWFGFTKEYLLGKTIPEVMTVEAVSVAEPFLHRALAGEDVHFQNTFYRKDGRQIHVDTTFVPDKTDDGQTKGFVILTHDITHEKLIQRELERAKVEAEEANHAKSQFLANMSHEIRTPLGLILGFSDLAIESLSQPEEAEGYLRTIRKSAESLSKLIGEILDLSKVEAQKLDVERIDFDLDSLLEEVHALLAARAADKGIAFDFAISGQVPSWIRTDPTRLRQILINLLGNAVKFTERGWVRLIVSATPMHPLSPRQCLRFEVRDSGIGLSEEQQAKLFHPFSQADSSMTRKFGGTGLGLALSRQLAKALGGNLELVRSQLGRGSVFVAVIEAEVVSSEARFENERMLPTQSSPSRESRLDGAKILLVEDSMENQILVSRFLKPFGADVELASNGQEGTELATSKTYDVILMDIQMPVLDGLSATRALRDSGYRGPIVALTAHAFQVEREKALRSGFDGYLTKPISKTVLIETIQAFLSEKEGHLLSK